MQFDSISGKNIYAQSVLIVIIFVSLVWFCASVATIGLANHNDSMYYQKLCDATKEMDNEADLWTMKPKPQFCDMAVDEIRASLYWFLPVQIILGLVYWKLKS